MSTEEAEGALKTLTDAEVVEICRKEMQGIMDRSDFAAPTQQGLIASVGLPHQEVQLFADDLTELGKFELDLPDVITAGQPQFLISAMRRHWVYRQEGGNIITLQFRQRMQLRAVGYARARGFINDVDSRS